MTTVHTPSLPADDELAARRHTVTESVQDFHDHLDTHKASFDGLITAIKAVQDARRTLALVEDHLVTAAARLPHDKQHTVDGVGTAEFYRPAAKTSWDDDDVFDGLTTLATVNRDTGEVASEPDPHRLLSLVRATARMSWRITDLREVFADDDAVDPDQWRHVTRGPLKVKIL